MQIRSGDEIKCQISPARTAYAFQSAGFIKYARGKVTIADHGGLKALACECYAIVKEEYDKTECYSL